MKNTQTQAAPAPAAQAVETKEQKLIRLANARVNKAIKAISLVGNLAPYKPTADQIGAIMDALQTAVNSVGTQLAPMAEPAKPTFSL